MSRADFGVIGLGVMGRNLVLNLEDQGLSVAVWNLESDWTDAFLSGDGKGRRISGTRDFRELAGALRSPRRILMMIKAGRPVDLTLEGLLPFLEPGDLVIDGGNSHFQDTERRHRLAVERGVHFYGLGVSGGEEGARHGPSLMPGGDETIYREHLHPVLEKIAAVSDAGPCVSYIGPGGAGHFVKMVHNGIEYGDMELIAEAYDVMSRGLGLEARRIAGIFAEWNRGRLSSYLIDITSRILQVEDARTGKPLVEVILDQAGQKGTGKWTAQTALDLGVPIPTINAALEARFLSALKSLRVQAAGSMSPPTGRLETGTDVLEPLEAALYASKICSYAQGMSLIRAGSEEYGWKIDLAEVCRIWKAGCIIRARLLDDVRDIFLASPRLPNLLLGAGITARLLSLEGDWRELVTTARRAGLPVLAMSASLAYFDALRSERLPLNLTQAQRDYFGAHRYQRVDDPGGEMVHTDWAAAGPSSEGSD